MNISENDLVQLLKNNTSVVFGEEIDWSPAPTIREEQNGQLRPDILGIDTERRIVIVEVKTKVHTKAAGNPNDGANTLDAGAAVGQILHYASAFIREDPLLMGALVGGADVSLDDILQFGIEKLRLFIVIQEPSLRTLQRVSKPCELLQAHGINIRCISLSNTQIENLKKRTV